MKMRVLSVCLFAFVPAPALTLAAQAATQLPRITVLAQSPADTDTDLQVICLFRSSPRNPLKGALTETDERLHGLLTDLRQPNRFHGELGETLLITPGENTLKAKRLLLVGLGDSQTFTPDRMRLIGVILFREADRLSSQHPYFAPTVKDGGVDKFTTGEIAGQVVGGFLEAYATESHLAQTFHTAEPLTRDLTYLAGKQYQASTQGGVDKAVRQAHN